MVNVKSLIRLLKPYFIYQGKPTRLVLAVRKMPAGQQLIQSIFAFYAANVSPKQEVTVPLDTNVDIELKRI